jgi:biopolymer transport protein ExbB
VLANIVLGTFAKGGWVMWPIAGVSFLALCVILDRTVWWLRLRESLRRDSHEAARTAIRSGDFPAAWKLGKNTTDPFLTCLHAGISHAHTSMLVAMQLQADQLIEKSQARMWVLSTLITLAPLLGLFGTVVGLMRSFAEIGSDSLAVTKVTGGIGEALVATACGIAIAVLCLLPYNFFRKRASVLRSSLEHWINHTELLVLAAGKQGHDLGTFASALRKRPHP